MTVPSRTDRSAPAGPGRWTCTGVPIDTVGSPEGGPPFGTEAAPAGLRARDLPRRLGALDDGDLAVRVTGSTRDPASGIVAYPSVRAMVAEVRSSVAQTVAAGRRPLLLGGCCALVMGAVAGTRDALGRVGLVSVDGHVDVYDGRSSPTGEAADMPVGALRGLGWPDLLAAMGEAPVLAPGDAVVLGARDEEEAADVGDLPERLGVVVAHRDEVVADPEAAGRRAAGGFEAAGTPYWLHLDVDVLGEDVFPATDYLMPAGLDLAELAEVLRPLAAGPYVAGFSLGCYNPSKDPGGRYGDALADLLVDVLGPPAGRG